MKRRVLLTGAAGYIGRPLALALARHYDLRSTDRKPPAEGDPPHIVADLGYFEAVQALCEGMDTVVHFAANPSPSAPWPDLLENNINATYNVFSAAADAGCRRVVFASSVQTVLAYPEDIVLTSDMQPRPSSLYGASKMCGEAMASTFVAAGSFSAICLRLGRALPRERVRLPLDTGDPRIVITFGDIARLVIASIEAPDDLRYGVFFGTSYCREVRFDISDASEQLHYEPQDDVFALIERHKVMEERER